MAIITFLRRYIDLGYLSLELANGSDYFTGEIAIYGVSSILTVYLLVILACGSIFRLFRCRLRPSKM